MSKITTAAGLREAILQLQSKQANDRLALTRQFHSAYESVKPSSLINSFVRDAFQSGELKDNLVKSSFGVTSTYISRLLLKGLTSNPVKKFLGIALMYGLTRVVTRNPGAIQYLGSKLFKRFKRISSGKRQVPA